MLNQEACLFRVGNALYFLHAKKKFLVWKFSKQNASSVLQVFVRVKLIFHLVSILLFK